jgi:predicted dithiol-disulfide oxidoreductase (DUF899 family)
MTHDIVSRQTWLAARGELLRKEKAHTQARTALAEERRQLPWVKLDKSYSFQDSEGTADLSALFTDQNQLIVYHLMFGPDWQRPCIGCTSWANAFNGTTYQFEKANAQLVAVSRAPYPQLADTAAKLGWSFPWFSSFDSDFNYDFDASSHDLGESTIVNGTGEPMSFDRGENHGVSVFARDEAGVIYHTYSAYNRGIEALNGAFGYFDLLPQGREW